MKISYRRTGGWKPPQDNERLDIQDDGIFTMWRSVGWATNPATPVGRFAGRLSEGELTTLQREASSAAQAGDIQIMITPDAPVEAIQVGGAKAVLGANDQPGGAWGPLVEHLRRLLAELTASPRAAVSVQVSDDGKKARLVHLGDEPLRLDLSTLSVRAVLWEDYDRLGDWSAPPRAAGDGHLSDVRAGPGWSVDLPFSHGFEVRPGSAVVAYVNFVAYDGHEPVAVSLQSPHAWPDE